MSTAEAQAELGRISAPNPVQSVADPTNRRFQTWGGVSATAKTSDLETARKAVEAACKNALISWPDAKAAILFGSRARGDHRTDSDWDIAFITSTKESLPDAVRRDLNELRASGGIIVHGLAISQQGFIDKANSFGNVAASIAHEGRLISGRCDWPETAKQLIMEPREYMNWRAMALRYINLAVVNFAKGIDNACTSRDWSAFKLFVTNTSDSAEYIAKMAFGKLASGTDGKFTYSHTVNTIIRDINKIFEKDFEHFDKELKKCIEEKAKWWLSDHGREFVDLLVKMNGCGNVDHMHGYEASVPDDELIARAANRLVAVACFAIREVEELPGPAGLREVAAEVADNHRSDLLESANRLREILQGLELSESTFSAAGPTLAKSAEIAAKFGEEIAELIEKLANSHYSEPSIEDRTEAAP